MFSLNSDLQKLKRIADKLQKEFKIPIGNITFSYEEQELIRRVFKSVITQFKNNNDKSVAKEILRKTEWIDER